MPTSYTSLLGLALPATGELSGTWGDTVNDYITQYLDASIAGSQTVSLDADTTLSKTTGVALDSTSSQYIIIRCTGARTAIRNITVPAASKFYIILNSTTGGYAVRLRGAGPTTGILISADEFALCSWNGSDFVKVSSANGPAVFSSLTLSGGTANGVLYLNGSKVATSGSALTFDGSNLGMGASLSPWVTLKAIQMAAGSVASNDGGSGNRQINLFNNTYYDGADFRYVATDTAQAYRLIGGQHRWFSAPPGTAGNVISFTQAMTLDATGNLGVGTTSPSARLESSVTSSGTTSEVLRLSNQGSGSNTQAQINFVTTATSYGTISGGYGSSAPQMTFNLPSATLGNYVWQIAGTESMRLDASGNLGIGTASPAARLHVSGTGSATTPIAYIASSVGPYLGFGVADSSYSWIQGFNTLPLYINHQGNDTIINGTTGNVGIGTTSPGSKLDVRLGSTTQFVRVQGATSGSSNLVLQGDVGSGPAFWFSAKTAAAGGYLAIGGNGGSEPAAGALNIDGSGNLGVGVTPSVWGSNFKAIESAAPSAFAISAANINGLSLLSNAYADNSNWRYTTTGTAARYAVNTNIHQWFVAPSGTAGNAISWTQAMTLDSSGQLMVKTTSASGGGITVGAGGLVYARSADDGSVISIGADNGGGSYLTAYKSTGGTLVFVTADGSGNNTERARIDAAGNVGIGTSSPVTRLDVSGGAVRIRGAAQLQFMNADNTSGASIQNSGATASDALTFYTSASERIRIDNSGNVGIGTSSPAYKLSINDSTGTGLGFSNAASGNFNLGLLAGSASLDAYVFQRANAPLIIGTNNTERARIDSTGNFIHQVNGTAPSLSTNSTMSFELTSNTSLKIVVRGSDGVTRSGTIALS